MVSTRAPSCLPAAARSPETCTASSRVGAMTSACGAAPSPPGRSSRLSSGTPKPSVLPVPVRAWPIRSLPASAIGRVSSWIAKVRTMPTSASAATISGLMSKSLNAGLSARTGARAASGAGARLGVGVNVRSADRSASSVSRAGRCWSCRSCTSSVGCADRVGRVRRLRPGSEGGAAAAGGQRADSCGCRASYRVDCCARRSPAAEARAPLRCGPCPAATPSSTCSGRSPTAS